MPSRASHASLPFLLSAVLVAAGCGSETAIDLTLVADPNVNDTSVLLQQLRSLTVVISSTDGLYDVTPASPGDDLQLKDVDGDLLPDLIAVRAAAGLDHLPRIRLERGGLRAVPMELRLQGGTSCQTAPADCDEGVVYFAAGGVKGVRFTEGTVQQAEVPFNERLLYRQPQVTQVNPENGTRNLAPGSFSSAVVIFSKAMNPDSVQNGAMRVTKVDGATETDVPAAAVTLTNLGGGFESPAIGEYRFQSPLGPGTYRVRVSTDARDASGRPLDQVPMQAGDQPFVSTFTVSGQVTSTTPMCNPCPDWCSEGGDKCDPGLVCDSTARICKPAQCPASCGSGTVCDPDLAVCVADCRVHGSFGGCPTGKTCLDSGVCR